MHLEVLKLTNYKNHEKTTLEFCRGLNFLIGKNGMGKTNVLDAIYYSCLGKSCFSSRDRNVLQHQRDFFRIESHFVLDSYRRDLIEVKYKKGSTKQFFINEKKTPRIADLVGRYPVVMISTQDDKIIMEGSAHRRKYFNNLLGQIDSIYISKLAEYHRLLKQRNSILKNEVSFSATPKELLMNYSEQMAEPASYIHKQRAKYFPDLRERFRELCAAIAQSSETTDMAYSSSLFEKEFIEDAQERLQKDIYAKKTTSGIHRDDLELTMNSEMIKEFGSQGQLKTCGIALKMAQFHLLLEYHSSEPITLLDDVFDRLDPSRVEHLIRLLVHKDMGQIFISDTDEARAKELLEKLDQKGHIFHVQNAQVERIQ